MINFQITPQINYPLPASGTWKESVHVFDQRSTNALMAAWLSERPLLVRGDPGTGKSQLARAAAVAMGWQFVSEVVNAHTEVQDLWYHFDAVSRLGQAQLLSGLGKNDSKLDIRAELDPKKFLSPGVLWWAYDWITAQEYYKGSDFKLYHPIPELADSPEKSENLPIPKGVVLLIDEIDKADADLPNSLLETLDNARFRVPWISEGIGYRASDYEAIRPLVIITTNEDRQLPPAFVRRCLVLNLELPEDEIQLVEYLADRGKQHYTDDNDKPIFTRKVLNTAASQLHEDRQEAESLGFKPPGQAEYLDMLRVLSKMELDEDGQLDMLGKIQDFALKKYPGMKQRDTELDINDSHGKDEAK